MALNISSIATLKTNFVAAVESKLSTTVPLLDKAFTRVLAAVHAGQYALLYKYGGWIFLQLFVQHASNALSTINGKQVNPLVLWSELVNEPPQNPAVPAVLTIEITVLTQTGTIPVNTPLVFEPTGIVYLTQAAVPLDAATKQVNVIASADPDGGDGSGTIGNLQVGDALEFANAPDNVEQVTSVVAVAQVGSDQETVERFRARVLGRFQKQLQGGAYADYEKWGEEVSGIINVYPYTGTPGVIEVFCEADEATDPVDGFPTAQQLQDVRDAINLDVSGVATRRPVNAALDVKSISRTSISFTVSGLTVEENLTALQDDIKDALDEYLRTREPWIEGLSVPPRRDRITVAEAGGIVAQVVAAHLGSFTTLTMNAGGPVINAYTLGAGEKAKISGPPVFS